MNESSVFYICYMFFGEVSTLQILHPTVLEFIHM